MEMYKCENCIGTKKLGFCEFCDDNDNYRRMTNADRVRAMSDEELCKLLSLDDEHDFDGIMKWLKQEVE